MRKGPTIEQVASKRSEDMQQAAFFMFCQSIEWCNPCLEWIHAIPNGGKRDKGVGGKMKVTGTKKGIHDIFLPFPNKGYHGLYIEMKRADGVPSDVTPEQREFAEYAKRQNYFVKICYGYLQAKETLLNYLS